MAIIGTDDRMLVADLSITPYSAIVQIMTTFSDGSVAQGSGVLIDENDVLTAAHVIYNADLGGSPVSIQVAPARDGNVLPFGVAEANRIWVSQGWIQTENLDDDLGLISLSHDIGTFAGTVPVAFVEDKTSLIGGNLMTAGYPGDIGGKTQTVSYGTVDSINHDIMVFEDDMDVVAGQSGSPVFATSNGQLTSIGVVSYETYLPTTNGLMGFSDSDFSAISDFIVINDTDLASNLPLDSLFEYSDVRWLTSVYEALLDKSPEQEAINYWLGEVGTHSEIMSAIAYIVGWDSQWQTLIDNNQTAELVQQFYSDAFNITGDSEGLNYWVNEIETGAMSAAKVIASFFEYEQAQGYELSIQQTWHSWVQRYDLESFGTASGETLLGTSGDDWISADAGNDTIVVSDGNDWVIAGLGNDSITLGQGIDFLEIDPTEGWGQDTVSDFNLEEDFILTSLNISLSASQLADGLGIRLSYENNSIDLLGIAISDTQKIQFELI